MIIDWKAVVGVLGVLLVALGVSLVAPAVVSLAYGEAEWWGFAATAAASLVGGGALWWAFRPQQELRVREGFAIVALAWLVLSLVGALPWVITGVLAGYTDAFFEVMSGFTTTGATILGGATTPAIEAVPNGFLFWRSLTHWLGGMGIIVLTIAVLPLLGVGGMQLFKAEVPGPSADKLTPRVTETAKRLWAIYLALTLVEVLLLLPAMSLFDAVNHAFATMATGGFSTENGSVGQYDSAYIDWVITVFMVLAGMNFALHYQLLHRNVTAVAKNEELRAYGAIIGLATVLLTLALWAPTGDLLFHPVTLDGEIVTEQVAAERTDGEAVGDELATRDGDRAGGEDIGGGADLAPAEVRGRTVVRYDSFGDALRYGAFQAASIITTTGFGTADYELWPPLALVVLFALFFVGGMAGSTGGGVKVVRVVLILKNAFRELRQLVHPQAILPIRLDHRVVPEGIMRTVLSFVVFYVGLIGLGTLIMGALGLDIWSAFSATFSCVGNVGPAFGAMGPTENYTHVPAVGKWVLSLLMMAGRLEIFTVLLLFSPAFWKR
ncbi:potassium transporter TrkG [Rubrivirga sp. S365]|uniref:Potassium transporter TrkG n=1 Tax=Rubrivirga litoralis TaxID=3075598 RepID=A0ABU3BU53_9BACT|nr:MULTISPECIES: potassium transporter TrkG [unclassified Rubrivirga]MDT0632820.1 potassium transporter TrkG [Rubrivirga sp. F394]MDT7855098.1 potassium transporter TrkG [Rubrivirga sp. S365]